MKSKRLQLTECDKVHRKGNVHFAGKLIPKRQPIYGNGDDALQINIGFNFEHLLVRLQ